MKDKAPSPLTGHASRVLQLLEKEARPLTAYAILDKLRKHGFRAPPTVYRALDILLTKGLIHKLESINAFVVCHHDHKAHSHISPFAICTSCHSVQEIEDKTLFNRIEKTGSAFLSHISSKILEITGLCHNCSRRT